MTALGAPLFVLLAVTTGAAETREQREVKLAEYAVFAAFAFGCEPLSSASDACPEGCCSAIGRLGTASAELGLILLGSKDSPEALTALIALLRLPLDASLGEMHTCLVLAKGKQVLPLLRRASPSDLARRCAEEWEAAQRAEPRPPGPRVERACAIPADIERRRVSLLEAVTKGRKCPPEDF